MDITNMEDRANGAGMRVAERRVSAEAVRVLVAEDDVVQRGNLLNLLAVLRPDWPVIAAVGTVEEAMCAVDALAPDLCLLDIHLEGVVDPAWVRQLSSDLAVIYVTGDPDYAVHAFDSSAVDYVLKPLTARRLKRALERAEADPRLLRRQMVPSAESQQMLLSHVIMARGTDTVLALLDDIIYLEADTKYTRVVTTRGSGLVRMGIGDLHMRLPRNQFVRIHRSNVVNVRYIDSVRKSDLGYLQVRLIQGGETLRVSKHYQHIFRPD
jgi:DNA-binding LytR/AlgR family response regulator